MSEELHKLIHGEGGLLDLVWMFYEGAIGIDPIISRIGKAYAEGILGRQGGQPCSIKTNISWTTN